MILRWHRQLIARKWTYAKRRGGRPGVLVEIRRLMVRMVEENPTWGYTRILRRTEERRPSSQPSYDRPHSESARHSAGMINHLEAGVSGGLKLGIELQLDLLLESVKTIPQPHHLLKNVSIGSARTL